MSFVFISILALTFSTFLLAWAGAQEDGWLHPLVIVFGSVAICGALSAYKVYQQL